MDPGLDLHDWDTRWQQALDDLGDDVTGALLEMDEVLTEMLNERGFQLDEPVTEEGEEPEIVRQYRAAHEVKIRVDSGSFDPGDVADAVENYRELYGRLINERAAP